MTHAVLTFNQTSFRFRNDDGSETAATWIDIADNDISWRPGTTNLRIRFEIQETAGGSGNEDFNFQYDKNAAASWTDVTTTSSNIRLVTSTNVTDGDAT
ncbi:MAG: hypothetical protein V3U84_02325, partial [Thiotrichaceae bacterium]